MFADVAVIDRQILLEASCDRGHDALPVHLVASSNFGVLRLLGATHRRQAADASRKERRANRIRIPFVQKLRGRPTNSALARTHAAAGVQLGGAPGSMLLKP